MSVWHYLKAGFWQRVPLPLLGRVPLNAAALAGFGVAGFDHPALWAAGAGWQAIWMAATAGRAGYRKKVDAARHREQWRRIEERRLQLYNQLPEPDRLRHHTLRQSCQALPAAARTGDPALAVELFTWLHLKLLLARHYAAAGLQRSPADPDLPRLQAGAAIDLTDPARSRLADEAVALLDPRERLADATQPVVPALDAALLRIEAELATLRGGGRGTDAVETARNAEAAAAWAMPPETMQTTREVDRLLDELTGGGVPERQTESG